MKMKTLTGNLLAILFLSCFLLQLPTEMDAACVCNEKGTDYCSGCSDRTVVRPKQPYYDTNTDLNLAPIGDNCWCSKLLIEPASLPKPCPKHKTSTYGCSQATYADNTPSYPRPVNYVPSDKPRDESLPADPISVALAIQAGKTVGVPEAKLSYGFVQKPIDGLKKIYFSNVPEENLFKLNNEVIVMKKRNPSTRPEEDEEWMEVEDEEEELADNDDEKPYFTYKQLGYVNEQFKNPKFRQVSYSSYNDDNEDEYGRPVYGRVSVDCGFKPGRVAYRKKTSKPPKPCGCGSY